MNTFVFMNVEATNFPQYRKMNGRNVWYKITSNESFIEIQQIGDRFVRYEIKAIQYPEKLRIMDMLSCQDPFVELAETEFYGKERQFFS